MGQPRPDDHSPASSVLPPAGAPASSAPLRDGDALGSRDLRNLPTVAFRALRLVWQAAGRRFLTAAALQLTAGVTAALQLVAARGLLDAVLDARRLAQGFSSVVPDLLFLLAVVAAGTAASVLQVEQQRLIGELVNRHVQGRIIDVAAAVGLDDYERPAFFDRLQRAQAGGQMRPWQMTVSLLALLNAGTATVGIVAVLVALQPLLLPMLAVAYVPLALASLRNSRSAHGFFRRMTAHDRERGYLGQVLAGRDHAKEVRLFHLAPFLRRRYEDLYDLRVRELEALARRRTRRSMVAGLLSAALGVGVLAILVAFLLTGRMDVASATAAAVGLQQLGGRLQLLYANAGGLFEGSLFVQDYQEFLAMPLESGQADRADHAVPPAPAPAPEPFRRLEVRDVSFRYPGSDRLVLDGVSLEIGAGEVVALVGENGSGKTTLAKLLCGLHRPTGGAVLWDGADATGFDPVALRRHIACVFQDFGRYQLPARDNIAMGRQERRGDEAGVVEAAERAGAHLFLSRLPAGYDTRLGRLFEGGVDLSIGQWQRLALARAFFRDAPFIILDEPTAALDARVEHELFRSMRELARGGTVLVISHRFSSVRSADRIVVLAGGRVVEQGSHDALMARGGLYAELFTLQASSYLDQPVEERPIGG